MGGAWGGKLKPIPPARGMMGQYGEQSFGLPLITDILQANGLAATFFIEPFNAELGYESETEPVCRYLLDRGQDIQLHIHPNRKQYWLRNQGREHIRTDNMVGLPDGQQLELIQDGSERLQKWTGQRPVAFRAGNMAASEAVLKQLASANIKIDSSYCFAFLGSQCFFEDGQLYNGSKWYGNVLELALSGFYQPSVPGLRKTKVLDPMGISFPECRDAITRICEGGADAVVILHSFSLFKVANVQYDGGRLNRIVARRFRRLCEWLSQKANELPVRTFSQLAGMIEKGEYAAHAAAPPRLGRPVRAVVRKAVQAVNNIYWV